MLPGVLPVQGDGKDGLGVFPDHLAADLQEARDEVLHRLLGGHPAVAEADPVREVPVPEEEDQALAVFLHVVGPGEGEGVHGEAAFAEDGLVRHQEADALLGVELGRLLAHGPFGGHMPKGSLPKSSRK